jgi:ADP-ribose pyrophosphatase YjhB (NUDIX family)
MDVWNLPGGRVESGELPTEAVVRETREETGLEVVVERLVGVYGKVDRDELVFAFVCRIVGGAITQTDEADACRFFSFDEIPHNTNPKQVERVADAIEDHATLVFRRQGGPTTRQLLELWRREERT